MGFFDFLLGILIFFGIVGLWVWSNEEREKRGENLELKKDKKIKKKMSKKTFRLILLLVILTPLMVVSYDAYSKNLRAEERAIRNENPDAYYANEFVNETEGMNTDKLFLYCSELVFDYFEGSKGNYLINYPEYFSKVDETCFSIEGIAKEVSNYIKEGNGSKKLKEQIFLNTSSILLKDSIFELLKEKELEDECRVIKSKYVGAISGPLGIISRAADIVVFPEKVTRAEADKFFDESIVVLKNGYNLEGTESSDIRTIVMSAKSYNFIIIQGLLAWQDGFWRYKGGLSSYESYYTSGDGYMDSASNGLRELQEAYNSLTCEQILDKVSG